MKYLGLVLALCLMGASAMCPGDKPCSGHGTCGSFDKCTCYRNWMNHDCSGRVCPYKLAWADTKDTTVSTRSEHYYAECSAKGICDRKTGTCECFDGFTGSGCDRMACPDSCNGHGVCNTMAQVNTGYTAWDAHKMQTCTCDPGWTGPSCQSRSCKLGDDPLTLQTIGTFTIQQDEVQKIAFTDVSALTGEFVIIYTDWKNKQWKTWTLDVATATAISITEALQGIPNSIIPSVTVSQSGTAASGSLEWIITFDSSHTPGDQATIIVDSTACIKEGCQPVIGTGITPSKIVVSTPDTGTEERVECSNRGICNAETGICKCSSGYGGEACNVQTVIT